VPSIPAMTLGLRTLYQRTRNHPGRAVRSSLLLSPTTKVRIRLSLLRTSNTLGDERRELEDIIKTHVERYHLQRILTSYVPATDTKSAKIKAINTMGEKGEEVLVEVGGDMDLQDYHDLAAMRMAEKLMNDKNLTELGQLITEEPAMDEKEELRKINEIADVSEEARQAAAKLMADRLCDEIADGSCW
jgi:hypothetical protein